METEKKMNIPALASAAVMIIAVMLPWAHLNLGAMGAFAGAFGGIIPTRLQGLDFGEGYICMISAAAAGALAFMNMKWSTLGAGLGLLTCLYFCLRVFFNSNASVAAASLSFSFGIWIELLACVACVIFTLKYWKKPEAAASLSFSFGIWVELLASIACLVFTLKYWKKPEAAA